MTIASQLRDSAGLKPGFPRCLQGLIPPETDREGTPKRIETPSVLVKGTDNS